LETDERISDREGMLIGRMMAFRMSQSDDWDDFEKLDFRNDIRQLEGKIRRERNNISKEELELLYIEYLAFAGIKTKVSGIEDEKVFTGELDKNLIKEALENIKPSSNFWYLYPQALRGGIENLPDQKDFIRSYLDQVIQNNTSTDLVSQVLLYALHFASQSNDSDLFDIYLGTLLSYYPETSGAYRAKRDFDIPSSISVGEKVPSFSITNLDGPVALNNQIMQGKYYLIDFWSTGCGGCIQAMPHHEEVYEKYKDKGFDILSISLDKPETVEWFRENRYPMPWTNGIAEGGFTGKIAKDFEVGWLPRLYLVDPAGIIIAKDDQLRGNELDKTLTKYLD
jgi:thiol-disulfide isomerase/thioredoxin